MTQHRNLIYFIWILTIQTIDKSAFRELKEYLEKRKIISEDKIIEESMKYKEEQNHWRKRQKSILKT